jgi:hypothetical protein
MTEIRPNYVLKGAYVNGLPRAARQGVALGPPLCLPCWPALQAAPIDASVGQRDVNQDRHQQGGLLSLVDPGVVRSTLHDDIEWLEITPVFVKQQRHFTREQDDVVHGFRLMHRRMPVGVDAFTRRPMAANRRAMRAARCVPETDGSPGAMPKKRNLEPFATVDNTTSISAQSAASIVLTGSLPVFQIAARPAESSPKILAGGPSMTTIDFPNAF